MEHTTKVIDNGVLIEIPKKAYNSDKEAITAARKMNLKGKQIHKAVAYKCSVCNKWHIGRNSKILTEKEKDRYKKNDLLYSNKSFIKKED